MSGGISDGGRSGLKGKSRKMPGKEDGNDGVA